MTIGKVSFDSISVLLTKLNDAFNSCTGTKLSTGYPLYFIIRNCEQLTNCKLRFSIGIITLQKLPGVIPVQTVDIVNNLPEVDWDKE
jgi:hypothetical protein